MHACVACVCMHACATVCVCKHTGVVAYVCRAPHAPAAEESSSAQVDSKEVSADIQSIRRLHVLITAGQTDLVIIQLHIGAWK